MKLVLDWDGTCTVVDGLHLVLERFGDTEVFERLERELVAGRVSYRELMEGEFATVAAPIDDVNAYLGDAVRLRDGFDELAARYRPLILSSGFHELIEPIVARAGHRLDVRANRVEETPAGWRIRWRDEARCPVCGDLCKRSALPGADTLVYVGDGWSDRCAALACDRIFARDGLASYLDDEGVQYDRFETLADVAAALA